MLEYDSKNCLNIAFFFKHKYIPQESSTHYTGKAPNAPHILSKSMSCTYVYLYLYVSVSYNMVSYLMEFPKNFQNNATKWKWACRSSWKQTRCFQFSAAKGYTVKLTVVCTRLLPIRLVNTSKTSKTYCTFKCSNVSVKRTHCNAMLSVKILGRHLLRRKYVWSKA